MGHPGARNPPRYPWVLSIHQDRIRAKDPALRLAATLSGLAWLLVERFCLPAGDSVPGSLAELASVPVGAARAPCSVSRSGLVRSGFASDVKADFRDWEIVVIYLRRYRDRQLQQGPHVDFWQRYFHEAGGKIVRWAGVD